MVAVLREVEPFDRLVGLEGRLGCPGLQVDDADPFIALVVGGDGRASTSRGQCEVAD